MLYAGQHSDAASLRTPHDECVFSPHCLSTLATNKKIFNTKTKNLHPSLMFNASNAL